jgi:NodT family efflux transporter outer membrane factor (OMF) lipoprotein
MKSGAALAALAALGAALAGCTVGPDYRGPPAAPPTGPAFLRSPDDARADPPPARWWTELKDPVLDRLIETALRSSPRIEVAVARVREARAQLAGERAKEMPTTGASGAYLRTHNLTSALGAEPSGGSSDSNIYAVTFDASWEVDLFGAHRRSVEGAAASLQGTRASLHDAQVSLSSEVARAYIDLRDAQERTRLAQGDIEIEERRVRLMQRRREGGTASELDVARVQSDLDNTRGSLAPLRSEVLIEMNRLAVLTGRAPGAVDGDLEALAAVPLPPEHLTIGDPASLVRRRPDVTVAERKLAQDTAAVGEDVAALFPKLTLLGDVGFAAPSPHALFEGASFTYVAAPLLQWTPLDFGRNRSRIKQARATRDEAEADYRRTVLAALEDAESSLARYGEQRNTVADRAAIRASAERIDALTEIRLRNGTASSLDILDAESKRVEAEISYEQALADLSTDFVALQKSLGLGWMDSAESGPAEPGIL